MVQIKKISNRKQLAAYFRTNPSLHIYSLGDLDDFFWPQADFFGIQNQDAVESVMLIYRGGSASTFIALGKSGQIIPDYIQQVSPYLPSEFEAHLNPGLESAFHSTHRLTNHGLHYKMSLADPDPVREMDTSQVRPLSPADIQDIKKLFQSSYPQNWFDPRMLETGQYFGIRIAGKLRSIAGVHVYSPRYRVAALGNITTHPDFRNRGFAKKTTSAVCQSLLKNVDTIGLNVKQTNLAAVRCYQALGFKITDQYSEYSLQKSK